MSETHLVMPFHIKPGAVVVLEGLDATGKSTQHQKMERAAYGIGHGSTPLFDRVPLFLHMPSAGTDLGEAIYEMTEELTTELDPLARQFLHLASHAQSVKRLIRPALKDGQPVILDRWWWSTFAYGWTTKRVRSTFNRPDNYIELCQRVWSGVRPDLIALFLHPHQDDPHNTSELADAYRLLAKDNSRVVLIKPGNEGNQGEQLYDAMVKFGIYGNGA